MKRLGLAGLLLLALSVFFQLLPAQAAPLTINEVQSGLLARDSLTTGSTAYWYFYGDSVLTGAPHTYSEDSQGLHIGIQANKAGTWIGFFAESPNTAGQLFHAVLTLPYSSIPSNEFNTGLYVQTSTDHINYITCAAQADSTGYYWSVVYTKGNAQSATQYVTVFTQVGGPNVPLSRDCTIITNGTNQMKVYLDGQLVYSSSSLNLQMPSPFNSYLEVQSTYASGMLYGKYNDYYATVSNIVQVQKAPPGDTAQVVDSKSNVLASATVGSTGVALLDIGQYHLPITGYVQVYDPAHNLVATTGGTGSIWGGDVYQAGTTTTTTTYATSSTTTTASTTITSTTTAGSTTSATTSSVTSTSSSTTASTSATSTATTTTFTTTTPTSSTSASTTTTATTSSTTVTSTTTATSSGVTSKLTVGVQDLYGSPLTGYYTELYKNGKKAADGYSPATYTLDKGQTYTVEADGYGSCPFDYWLDTGSTNNQRNITLAADTALTAVLKCGTSTTSGTTTATTATTTTTTTISTSTSTTTTATSTTSSSTTSTVTTTTSTTSPSGGTSHLTINTQDTNGNPLTGYYTAVYQNNQTIATGDTPAIYTLNNGQTYTVEADGFGTCVWYHWLDTGSMNNQRNLTLTADATLTAVLKCGP